MRTLAPWLPLALAMAVPAASCGGAAPAAEDARSSSPADEREDETTPSRPDEEDELAPAAPTVSRCEDGSCFSCGQGMCPKGFYCDERAVGGAACSWLPSCAAEPSCACIKRTLGSGCTCEEREGGVFVTCK